MKSASSVKKKTTKKYDISESMIVSKYNKLINDDLRTNIHSSNR